MCLGVDSGLEVFDSGLVVCVAFTALDVFRILMMAVDGF